MYKYDRITFDKLLDDIKKNHIIIDLPLLKKAYNKALIAHKNVFRKTGEKYIYHPLAVADILVSLKLDNNTIIAAILHDTVEDSNITLDNIKEEFGEDIAKLVDGVTKISQLTDDSENINQNFENVRKFLIASSEDIRIVILKLADRLHNVYTINGLPKLKQISYAKETMNIYSPLAEYLGMNAIKAQLDDMCFSILHRKEFKEIQLYLDREIKDFEDYSSRFIEYVKKVLDENNIHCEIFGRRKNIYSIYNKILRLNGYFDISFINQLNDLIAFTILVDSIEVCYKTLGVIHTLFQYISSKFDDYIARPKPNGFRTLQTSVYALDSRVVEVQIKTYDMHEYNEYGPASHIVYKINGSRSNVTNKFLWIKNLVLWRNNNNEENNINIFKDRIYVLTPKGLVKELEKDSTPIDFAYMIHTDIGNSMIGAKVNNKMVSLNYKLQTGDIVEILVSKNKNSSHVDWLDIAKMASVKHKIRKFLKESEENIKQKDINEEIIKPSKKVKIIKKKKPQNIRSVTIEGFDNIPIKFAKCCNPQPFKNIIGYISSDGYIVIHESVCSSVKEISSQKKINVDWDKANTKDAYFPVVFLIEGISKDSNIDKILEQITKINLNILNISSVIQGDMFNISLEVDILNNKSTSDIMDNLKLIEGVNIVKIV